MNPENYLDTICDSYAHSKEEQCDQIELRELLNAGAPSVGTHVMTTSPDIVEMIGKTGLIDYIEFVAEYAPYSLVELDNFGRALELGGMSGMIKVDRENRGWVAQRAVGSGFQNVLFSDVHDAAEAEECVAIVRAESPQTGGHFGSADRRFASYGLESGSPEYVQALEDSVVALMIEKDEAVKHIEEIMSVPGVDMIVFGGNDYSMSRRPTTSGESRRDQRGTRPYIHGGPREGRPAARRDQRTGHRRMSTSSWASLISP